MFELDKQQFGAFVADQRRQKQMTQKDLAQKLMISDKAVSKWERGLNMPDITLLVPLAQALDVSVAELLECRRISQSEPMSANQVDKLVKKAITMSEEDPQERKQRSWKNGLLLLLCFAISLGGNRSAAALSSSDSHGVQRFILSGTAQRDLWSLLLPVRAGKTARLL